MHGCVKQANRTQTGPGSAGGAAKVLLMPGGSYLAPTAGYWLLLQCTGSLLDYTAGEVVRVGVCRQYRLPFLSRNECCSAHGYICQP